MNSRFMDPRMPRKYFIAKGCQEIIWYGERQAPKNSRQSRDANPRPLDLQYILPLSLFIIQSGNPFILVLTFFYKEKVSSQPFPNEVLRQTPSAIL